MTGIELLEYAAIAAAIGLGWICGTTVAYTANYWVNRGISAFYVWRWLRSHPEARASYRAQAEALAAMSAPPQRGSTPPPNHGNYN